MNNPLLNATSLPLFDQILPEHVGPAIRQLIKNSDRAIDIVTDQSFPADWQAISKELDVSTEKLSMAWGAVSHLNSVADNPELRSAYNESLPLITEFFTRLGSHQGLYAKYKKMDLGKLNSEQTQARNNALRDFLLGGAELQGSDRNRFTKIQERQAELSQKFGENSLDATDQYAYFAELSELPGVPQDVIDTALIAAKEEGKAGYKITLKMSCYLPILQFCVNQELRKRIYRAYVTRASDQAPADSLKFDNTNLINEILKLRHEEANLLGFSNYGELSIAPKMAKSTEQVISFLRELAFKARPYAEQDVKDMREFATNTLGLADPNAWDFPFIAEKLKEFKYSFSEQEVKSYFTEPKVLSGLFTIIENLFEVIIRPDHAPVWNEKVGFYRIERDGDLIGQFYLDKNARQGKRGGAWMDGVRSRWLRPDNQKLQTPVAHLVCNFAEGVNGQPALLTHDDVTTLFHEFGHGLHHMLTKINEHDISGINGVEWDAVELPSQFMENFCWEWNVVKNMTSHIDTNEHLPRALFEKMVAAKNFQSGLQTLRQIEFALFDMLLHTENLQGKNLMDILENVRNEVSVLKPPIWNRTAHTFSHIFSGGYAAGYYSYKWAEVLSADAYSYFEEMALADGSTNLLAGKRFRKEILETGGSRPAMTSFQHFRGRDPSVDALLKHQGMTEHA